MILPLNIAEVFDAEFFEALTISGAGMAGIFIVIGIIIASITLLNKFGADKKEK